VFAEAQHSGRPARRERERQERTTWEQEWTARATREHELLPDGGFDLQFQRAEEEEEEESEPESESVSETMAVHLREPSPDGWLDDCFEDNHLEFLRDEHPDLSDDALEDIYYDRMQADAEEFGGYCSDNS